MTGIAEPVLAGGVVGPGDASATHWAGAIYAVVALTFLLLAGFGATLLARRYLLRRPPASTDGFELHDIRKLLADGKISQEEYDHLKEQMVSRFAAGRPDQAGP